jgi:hypothetical protein
MTVTLTTVSAAVTEIFSSSNGPDAAIARPAILSHRRGNA